MSSSTDFNFNSEDFAYAALISYGKDSQNAQDAVVEVQQAHKSAGSCIKALLQKLGCVALNKNGNNTEFIFRANIPAPIAILLKGLISILNTDNEVVKAKTNTDLPATLILIGFPQDVALATNEPGEPFEVESGNGAYAVMVELPRDAGNYYRRFKRVEDSGVTLEKVKVF